jgi:hypothetical protein
VTNISYDLNADSMELLFTPLRGISDEEYALVVEAQADPETKKYVQLTVAATDGATKPAAKAEPKPEPKPVVTRSAEPDDEDEAPAEPVKRSAKPTAVEEAPAVSGDLASIVNAWGDDAEDEE